MLYLHEVLNALPDNTDVVISDIEDTRRYITENHLEGTVKSFLNSQIVSTGNVEVLKMSIFGNKIMLEIMACLDEEENSPF